MKKHIVLILAAAAVLLALLLSLAGCGEKTPASSGGTSFTPASGGAAASSGNAGGASGSKDGTGSASSGGAAAGNPDAYVFRAGSVEIPVSVKAAPVLASLGEEKGYFEAESCAGLGTERYYIYSGYEVMTVEYYDEVVIGSVYLMDDTVSTPEGISLGASEADVTRVYGDADLVAGNEYTYVKGNCNLVFVFSGGVLMSVEYQANDLYD